MHRNSIPAKVQRRRFKGYTNTTQSHDFFNVLTSDAMLDVVDQLAPEHRERQFPPTETLSMFIAQALQQDGSCQKAVNDWAVQRSLSGLSSVSTATGGYCRARQRL